MKNFKLFISFNISTCCGLFFIIVGLIISWGNLIDYNIYKNGFPVIATVIEAPTNCNNVSSRGGYCTLEYKKTKFVLRAGNKFCHLVSGKKTVQMLTDYSREDLLFPGEFTYFEFSTGFIFIAIGIIIVIKYFVPLSKINPSYEKSYN